MSISDMSSNKQSEVHNGDTRKNISVMTSRDKEIFRLISQIDNEIEEINEEKNKIEDTVKKQIEFFWDDLPIDRKKTLEKEVFTEMYRDGLKTKILYAFDKAESKLRSRKKQLTLYLS